MELNMKTRLRALSVGLLVTMLSACTVVETNSRLTQKKDLDKAFDYHVQVAFVHLQKGNTEPAKQKLNYVLEREPNNAAALAGMALALEKEGEPEEADSYYRRSIAADSSYTRGKELYGAFLFSQGEYQGALNQFEFVVKDKLYENLSVANLNLGLCALRLDQTEKARQAFEKSVAINSKQTQAYLQLAKISFEEQDFRFAVRYFRNYERNLGAVTNYTPRSLFMGYQISEGAKQKNQAKRYTQLLKKLYPNSPEYALYLKIQSQLNDAGTTGRGKEG